MPTDLIIRVATSDDAPAIAAIWNHYIRHTAVTFNSQEKTDQDVAADIESKSGAFWVASDGDTIGGFATYGAFRGGVGYARTKEHTIQLDPAFSGRGAGRALMDVLCAHAKAQGIHSLWAGISEENPAGVAFHRAIGFEHVAILPEVGFKFDRWMDLVLMQKFL